MRQMLKSKIHRVAVTRTDLDYEGSIEIDGDLMDAADILPHEKVLVVNINAGSRFETYATPGEPGSGVVCVNGAAARLAQKGDKIIVMSFGLYDDVDARSNDAVVVHVDERNGSIRTLASSHVG